MKFLTTLRDRIIGYLLLVSFLIHSWQKTRRKKRHSRKRAAAKRLRNGTVICIDCTCPVLEEDAFLISNPTVSGWLCRYCFDIRCDKRELK